MKRLLRLVFLGPLYFVSYIVGCVVAAPFAGFRDGWRSIK